MMGMFEIDCPAVRFISIRGGFGGNLPYKLALVGVPIRVPDDSKNVGVLDIVCFQTGVDH